MNKKHKAEEILKNTKFFNEENIKITSASKEFNKDELLEGFNEIHRKRGKVDFETSVKTRLRLKRESKN